MNCKISLTQYYDIRLGSIDFPRIRSLVQHIELTNDKNMINSANDCEKSKSDEIIFKSFSQVSMDTGTLSNLHSIVAL